MVVLVVDIVVLLEVIVGIRGNDEFKEGIEFGFNGIDGIEGLSGIGLFIVVLVKVEVFDIFVRVGVVRFSNRDVRGFCMK